MCERADGRSHNQVSSKSTDILLPQQKHVCLLIGGNGKQIFGDCWWLDTEGEAVINPVLSDQSIQAYLASSHGRPGGSRPLANHLHTPKSIMGSPEAFRHDLAQVPCLGC